MYVENWVNKPATITFFKLNPKIRALATTVPHIRKFHRVITQCKREGRQTARIDSLIISLYGGCSEAAEAFLATPTDLTVAFGAISTYFVDEGTKRAL